MPVEIQLEWDGACFEKSHLFTCWGKMGSSLAGRSIGIDLIEDEKVSSFIYFGPFSFLSQKCQEMAE